MFSGGRLYAKGKGSLFLAWVIDKYPDRVVYILHRADLGTRLDSTTEVALALYMNRDLFQVRGRQQARECPVCAPFIK